MNGGVLQEGREQGTPREMGGAVLMWGEIGKFPKRGGALLGDT